MSDAPFDPRKIGETLSHYRLLEKLGKGGMGEVFIAEDLKLGRRVALKILPEDADSSPERLERFRREARTVAALNHPNIVTIFSVEEDRGVRFLTMELVEGESLRQSVLDGGLGPGEFLDLAIDLTGALIAAHQRGVVHRDLKPENVMVTDSGTVKVLDFGIAKLVHSDSNETVDVATQSLTRDGCVVGTIPYMSPEQLRGLPAGPQSDIFSLGIIFFEMLTGERPFQGQTSGDMISAILRDAPASLERFRGDISPAFEPIVRRCLEKEPKKRYQSAQELHGLLVGLRSQLDLERVLSGGHVVSRSGSFGPFLRRVVKQPGRFLVNTRWGLCILLGLAFLANYVETTVESWASGTFGMASEIGFQLAKVAHDFEGSFVFENHDHANALAIYGFSTAYYFLFPLMALYCLFATAKRPDITPFRIMALSPVFAYLVHLPFFIFLPLPERWVFPNSGAILLSDLWSTRLIETIRPISGLDNCFPSFHVSMTVVLIVVCYLYRVRFRFSICCLGLTVILATLVLGIHWMIDVIGGLAVATIAIWMALKFEQRLVLRSLSRAG